MDEFLRELLPHDDLTNITVSEYTFADLNASGSLELVASLGDGSGRDFYPTIVVVAKSPGGFTYSEAYNGGGMDVPSLDEVLVRVNGHRGLALLLPRRPGAYEGARPVPVVFDIYKYEEYRIHRADLEFSNYYKQVLIPKLRADIRGKHAEMPSGNSDINYNTQAEIIAQQAGVAFMEKMLQTGVIPSCTYGRSATSSESAFHCVP